MKVCKPGLRFRGFNDEWKNYNLYQIAKVNPKVGQLPDSFIYIDLNSVKNGELLKQNRISKLGAPSRAQRLLKKNDIIFQTVRPYQRNNLFFDEETNDVVASTGYAQIRTKEDPNFLYQYLHTNQFVNKVLVRSTGTNYPAINSNDLSKILIRVPAISEQRQIAYFLNAVDDKISGLIRKKGQLEKYKQGVMQAIFSQKIRFKDENGKDYPNWDEKELGNIGKTYNGLIGKNALDFGHGFPYITYKQIFDSSIIDKSKFSYVKINANEKQNKAKKGDIFFTTSSETPAEVGLSSVLLDEINCLYLNSFCFGYRINDHYELTPLFAQFLFRSSHFRRIIIKLAQGSTRFNMSKNELMRIKISIPTLEEQQKISNLLTTVDDRINLTKKELEQVKIFKNALLQQIFV